MSKYPTDEAAERAYKKFERSEFVSKHAEKLLMESDARWQFALEGAGDGVWDWNVVTNEVFFSRNWKEMLGFEEHEIGNTIDEWEKRVHPEDLERVHSDINRHFSGQDPVYINKHRMLCKNGKYKWILDRGKVISRTPEGKPLRVIGTHADITDRMRVEEKLNSSLSLLEATLESTADGILVADGHGKMVRFNKKFAEIWKLPIDILVSGDDNAALNFVLAQLKDPEAFLSKVRELYISPEASSFDVLEFTDGRIFERYSQPQRIRSRVIGRVWSFRDVTERKRIEKALRESERKYRLIAENTADLISILDMNLHFTYVSPASMRIRGFTVEEAIAQPLEQVLTPESMRFVLAAFEEEMLLEADETANPDRTRILELEEYKKDGSTVWMEVSLSYLRDKEGRPVEILAVSRDITDRKRTEVALRESEEKFRLTYNSSPDAVNINRLDDGLYVDVNEGFTRATGYTREEVVGRTSLELNIWHDPADRQKLEQGLREKGYYENLEAQFRKRDGGLITALMSARVILLKGVPHIMSITRDISESKLVATKLQQAQKFEAIGTLAGGIAHDFNNLLMGIQGRVSLMSLDLEASHPHQEQIRAIEEYIRSATSLTQQLLGFARGGKYTVNPVDMNELVQDSSAMFSRTKKEIRIHTKCQASPLVVEADRGQIEQVLLNMYINAWQAMPSVGGELYLETDIVMLDEAHCKTHQTTPGLYVKVSITDTGTGMSEAIRLQIFDPFFTTKEKGRGTGLGLASAYGIIKNHGGMITVYSEVGHGTTFNIYLPASDKEAHQEVPVEGALITGSATILLIDDEELIIDVGKAMLEKLGYRVVICMGGQEAVKVITNMAEEIDLVILDMIMPGLDGGSTFDCIRRIQPDMPVLLSSGYAINGHADKIMRKGCNGFIQKPYRISELSQKIRKVLDEAKVKTQQ